MPVSIKSNKTELALVKSFPVDEWFTLYDPRIKLSANYANRLMNRFPCVESARKAKTNYYISSENKERLIECIKLNPQSKVFDISLADDRSDDMWHKLLGTKQGAKHEGTN